MKIGAGVAIALLVIFGIGSYTKNVEARALLRFRADSLDTARAQVDSLQLERNVREELHQVAIDSLGIELASAMGAMERLRSQNTRRREVLDTVLVEVPDTIRAVIIETIEGFEAETQACRLALGTCEQAVSVRDSMIAGRDSTISELRPLLTAYEDQLANAIRVATPSPTRWIERGLAVYGIVEIVRLIAR